MGEPFARAGGTIWLGHFHGAVATAFDRDVDRADDVEQAIVIPRHAALDRDKRRIVELKYGVRMDEEPTSGPCARRQDNLAVRIIKHLLELRGAV